MVRTQVYLTGAQHRALKEEAEREGVSMTERLRRILANHFQGRRGVAAFSKEDVLGFIDLGESGRTETSECHDEALDRALGDDALR